MKPYKCSLSSKCFQSSETGVDLRALYFGHTVLCMISTVLGVYSTVSMEHCGPGQPRPIKGQASTTPQPSVAIIDFIDYLKLIILNDLLIHLYSPHI